MGQMNDAAKTLWYVTEAPHLRAVKPFEEQGWTVKVYTTMVGLEGAVAEAMEEKTPPDIVLFGASMDEGNWNTIFAALKSRETGITRVVPFSGDSMVNGYVIGLKDQIREEHGLELIDVLGDAAQGNLMNRGKEMVGLLEGAIAQMSGGSYSEGSGVGLQGRR